MTDFPSEGQPPGNSRGEAAPETPALLDPKLASELTLGLLHNANNAMTGLFFILELVQEEVEAMPELREQLNEALTAVQATQTIIDRTAELHLALRERSYHEAGGLLHRQLDLLKFIVPKNTATEVRAVTESLNLHIDEAGFRRLLLGVIRWVRPAMVRPPRLILGVRGAVLSSNRQPAVAFYLETPAENVGTPPTSLDVAEYGGEIAVHRLSAPRGVEVALLLPTVQLDAES